MNESPGWVSPGSSASDPREPSGGQEQPPSADPPQPPPQQPPRDWSAKQPTAPGQSGPTPAPAPPGGPGWSNRSSVWNQPPAAQPGIVPLRPLGIGEILDGAVSTMRAHWRTVLGISLTVALISQLAGTVAIGLWFQDTTGIEELENDQEVTSGEFLDAMGGLLSGVGVALTVTLLGTIVATAMLTMVISRAVLGRSVSITEAWRDSRPQLPRLFGLLLLLPLIAVVVVLVGTLPGITLSVAGAVNAGRAVIVLGVLAALVVSVWLWILLSLAAPALMLEKQGVLTAMRRSVKLVRGSWWRVFGILLLTQILVFLVSGAIEVPTDLIGRAVSGDGVSHLLSGDFPTGWTYLTISGIGAVIAATVTLPISAGVMALLYLDQRIRREALDLELARAAGVPGFASGPPASGP